MIKGINKQILEVTNTESPYFEKIIFFVRPEGQQLSEQKLKIEAEKFSSTTQKPPRARKSVKDRLYVLTYALLGIGAGVALSIIFTSLV